MSNSLFDLLQLIAHVPRRVRKRILLLIDAVLILVAIWACFAIRLGEVWPAMMVEHGWLFPAMGAAVLSLLGLLRLYDAVVRRAGAHMLIIIAGGLAAASIMVYGVSIYAVPEQPPLSVWYNFPLVATGLLGGYRLLFREIIRGRRREVGQKRVLIYGAGDAGTRLARALEVDGSHDAIAFVDDDPDLHGCTVRGLKVYDSVHLTSLIRDAQIERVLIAIPSAPRSVRARIIRRLKQFLVEVLVIPGLQELASGQVRIDDVRPVDIEDLLGRDTVPPDEALLGRCVTGRRVLVTGAGGSIGSELCRQIVQLKPDCLVLFEQSELALYTIEKELRQASQYVPVVPVLGDVQDRDHIGTVLLEHKIHTVYHAAAYKQVPLVEVNAINGVRNNVFGTLHTAQAAIAAGVERFVLISTDKAVRPTNVMGASKRMAELTLQALSEVHPDICFSMVRFGNVLGSSGSVVPLFKEQIRSGGPVTVTHPDVTRYFMTIPEAVSLVLQAGSMAERGEVFLLDMGEPVKIVDLARQLIQLSGHEVRDEDHPDGSIEIEFIGLRPGEKLYEELLLSEADEPTDHPLIRKAYEDVVPWTVLSDELQRLRSAIWARNGTRVREILQRHVDGYEPGRQPVDAGGDGARAGRPSSQRWEAGTGD